jgi:gamma-glutamylcyclotransferase (GGCT)/AIG2-like uncharacterized protein YtfP
VGEYVRNGATGDRGAVRNAALYEGWEAQLIERFGTSFDSAERLPAWNKLKQELCVGAEVRGEVVAKAPFGAWIDLDLGFPGLLLIPYVEALTPECYQADQWLPVGTDISAAISAFNDSRQQIGLMQQFPAWARMPLFVFGTLRRGHCNHHYLEGHYDRLIPARLHGYIRRHPLMIVPQPGGVVDGELFFLKESLYEATLAGCDALEEIPTGQLVGPDYRRKQVIVESAECRVHAWAYVAAEPH